MLFWTIVLKDCLDNYRVINYYNIYNCCQNFAVIVCPMLLEFLFDCYFPFTDTNYFSLSHWYMFWKFFRNTTIVMKIEFILFMNIFIHVNHKDILWNCDKYTISNKNIFFWTSLKNIQIRHISESWHGSQPPLFKSFVNKLGIFVYREYCEFFFYMPIRVCVQYAKSYIGKGRCVGNV